jgi:hypothetical protein
VEASSLQLNCLPLHTEPRSGADGDHEVPGKQGTSAKRKPARQIRAGHRDGGHRSEKHRRERRGAANPRGPAVNGPRVREEVRKPGDLPLPDGAFSHGRKRLASKSSAPNRTRADHARRMGGTYTALPRALDERQPRWDHRLDAPVRGSCRGRSTRTRGHDIWCGYARPLERARARVGDRRQRDGDRVDANRALCRRRLHADRPGDRGMGRRPRLWRGGSNSGGRWGLGQRRRYRRFWRLVSERRDHDGRWRREEWDHASARRWEARPGLAAPGQWHDQCPRTRGDDALPGRQLLAGERRRTHESRCS